jgi:serpin B
MYEDKEAKMCKTWKTVLAILAVLVMMAGQAVMGRAVLLPDEVGSDLVKGNTAFALDLYRQISEVKGNIFFSPYSISTALAMTYAGARENTAKQMEDVLHFTLPRNRLHREFGKLQGLLNEMRENADVQLNIANSIWPQKDYPFIEEFKLLLRDHYGVNVTPLDFRKAVEDSRKTINRWVEGKTENKIKELLKPGILNYLTRLVLVNAIYFKGDWASQFDENRTENASFYPLGGKLITVPMMHQKQKFKYAEYDGHQVLEMPYKDNVLSMVILLPTKKDGLKGLEKRLTVENLEQWTKRLRKRDVLVYIPKFKMTSGFRMDDTLQKMGMVDAFHQDRADFSGMDGQRHSLFIGAVIHKATIDVNEEGTEAAAATAVVMRIKGGPLSPPPVFKADHPFILIIRDNITHSILFMGRVMNPS